ncbi:MAG: cytochrome c peroxidase [Vicingaceae bacterium]
MIKSKLAYIFFLIIILMACRDDDDGGSQMVKQPDPTPVELEVPTHFFYVGSPFVPADNPTTEEGIALGKKLFFEKKLSRDNSISCSSCHNPSLSFNDKGNALSQGVDGTFGIRNAMPLFNLAWVPLTSGRFNWHGAAMSLEEQAFEPVRNQLEMKQSWEAAVAKLQADPSYPPLFNAAFKTTTIDSNLVVKALAQFERTLISGNTRVDKHVQKEVAGLDIPGGPFLTDQELRGYDLFVAEEKGDCFHCHGTFSNPLWTNNLFMDNGLDVNPDSGLAENTGRSADLGKFRVPSIRNLGYTAPYMHDGRFNTLMEVLDHYDTGIQNSPNLDPNLDPNAKPRNLTLQEKEDIIAFLMALNDSSFVNNPAFQP